MIDLVTLEGVRDFANAHPEVCEITLTPCAYNTLSMRTRQYRGWHFANESFNPLLIINGLTVRSSDEYPPLPDSCIAAC